MEYKGDDIPQSENEKRTSHYFCVSIINLVFVYFASRFTLTFSCQSSVLSSLMVRLRTSSRLKEARRLSERLDKTEGFHENNNEEQT